MRMENVKFWDFRASQQGKQKSSKHPFKFPSQRKLFSQSEKKVFLVRKKVFSRQRKKRGKKALIEGLGRGLENIIRMSYKIGLFE